MATNPTTTTIILIIIAVAVIVAVVAFAQRNRSKTLQKRFGPEYDQAVRDSGSRSKAENDLIEREKRVKRMHIGELSPGAKARYTEEWRTVQTRFVDEPRTALVNADQLISNVMRDRGYQSTDFDQSVADLSPDHPHVLQNYRAAHDITQASEHGDATTEDLRQAMVYYRSLFDDLVESRTGGDKS